AGSPERAGVRAGVGGVLVELDPGDLSGYVGPEPHPQLDGLRVGRWHGVRAGGVRVDGARAHTGRRDRCRRRVAVQAVVDGASLHGERTGAAQIPLVSPGSAAHGRVPGSATVDGHLGAAYLTAGIGCGTGDGERTVRTQQCPTGW